MSDDKPPMQATPASTLEQHIMDPRVAKSEAEWWASREIERLRARVAELEYAYSKCLAAVGGVQQDAGPP
jgi:hypothetical protein